MKKGKVNPVMMDTKKIKGIKSSTSEDTNEIKSFIIIVLVIAISVTLIYFLTEKLKKKDDVKEDTIAAGKINYDRISIGTLFNRNYKDYYVMIYDSNDDKAIIYSTLMSGYTSKEGQDNYIKLYFCDLANSINRAYYNKGEDNTSNPKATSIEELDLGDLTLIHVKKGKIVEYIEDYNKIVNILK